MKRILAFAAFAAVAACSQPAPAPEAEASATAPAAGPLAADGKSSVGTFSVTDAEGKVYTDVVNADGTYTTSLDGKVVDTGKWNQKSPELYCYTKDTKDPKDAKEECNAEKVENGVWTTKNPDGKVSTVVRVS